MPLITLGENDELKLKIPSRGDIDWAEDFKLYFANPIVKHDHSGVNGMGKQLGANSLANNSIEERHVNFGLGALNEVSIPSDSTQIAADSYLRWTGNAWQPGSLDPAETSVYNPVSTGEGGAGGINTSELSEIYITELTNSDFPNGSWGGATSIDLTSKGDIDGVKIIVDVPNPDGKKLIVQSLTSCVIISNIDIEVTQTINKCIMILENDDSTSANPSCNLILTNTGTDPIIDACDVMADSIISGSHTATKTLFRDSKIKIQDLDLQMTAAATSIIKSERSEVDISGEISNSVDLSSDSNPKLVLDNSKISFTALNQIGTGIFSTDANSELKQIASNYVKVWNGTRWNYLVSPSGTGKIIVSNNGEPSERDFTLGNVNNVDTTGQSTNKILRYNGTNWVTGPQIIGNNTIDVSSNGINTSGGSISTAGGGIDTASASNGQYLVYNQSTGNFEPQTLESNMPYKLSLVEYTHNSSGGVQGWSESIVQRVSSVPANTYYIPAYVAVTTNSGLCIPAYSRAKSHGLSHADDDMYHVYMLGDYTSTSNNYGGTAANASAALSLPSGYTWDYLSSFAFTKFSFVPGYFDKDLLGSNGTTQEVQFYHQLSYTPPGVGAHAIGPGQTLYTILLKFYTEDGGASTKFGFWKVEFLQG